MFKSTLILPVVALALISTASVNAQAGQVTHTTTTNAASHGIKINSDGSFTTTGDTAKPVAQTAATNKVVTTPTKVTYNAPATTTATVAAAPSPAAAPVPTQTGMGSHGYTGLDWKGVHIRNNNRSRTGVNE